MIARIAGGACAVAALMMMTGAGDVESADAAVALDQENALAMMAAEARPDPSLDCLQQWIEYWKKVQAGEQAEMPSCMP